MNIFGILLSLGCIIGLLCLSYIIFKEIIYPKYKEKKYASDLFDKARWIAIKSSAGSIFINDGRKSLKEVRDRDLIDYIIREQNNLKNENKYCLDVTNEIEIDFICDVLEAHQKEVINSLFYDSLKKNKLFYNLNFLEYYMLSLWVFLEKNEKQKDFNDTTLFSFLREDGAYTTYKLTDYGIAYEKLRYIITLFCVDKENIKPFFTNFENTLNNIKKILENKEIIFWSYRP